MNMETEVSVPADEVENEAANKRRRVEKEPQATPAGLDFISNLPNDMLKVIISLLESTSAPWVILVINVKISLVGLILLSSIFQISPTVEWHGQEDVEPLQDVKDKGLAQAQSSGLYIFYFSDPRSH